jgi:hypothetical protein
MLVRNCMDLSVLFDNKYLIGLISGAGGIVATICVQQILNRRGLLTYFVRHERIGVSNARYLGLFALRGTTAPLQSSRQQSS